MGKMLVQIDDEVERRIRVLALERYGKRRGSLSRVVEEALRLLLKNEPIAPNARNSPNITQ